MSTKELSSAVAGLYAPEHLNAVAEGRTRTGLQASYVRPVGRFLQMSRLPLWHTALSCIQCASALALLNASAAYARTDQKGESYEIREDAAIATVLQSRVTEQEGGPICFNRTLRVLSPQEWNFLKKRVAEADQVRRDPAFARLLKRTNISQTTEQGSPRISAFSQAGMEGLQARVATFEECSNVTTYRIYRVILGEKKAFVTAVKVFFTGTQSFLTSLVKDGSDWSVSHSITYDATSGPPNSGQFRRIYPGEGSSFIMIGGRK